MSTREAAATTEAQEPGSRIKSSSPRQIPVVGVVTEDEEAQVRAAAGALGREEEGGRSVRCGRGWGLGAARTEMGARVETRGARGTAVPSAELIPRELRRL